MIEGSLICCGEKPLMRWQPFHLIAKAVGSFHLLQKAHTNPFSFSENLERVRSSFHYSWKQSGSSGPTCNFANDDGYKSNEMFFLAVLSFFFLHSTSFGCLSVCLNDKQFGPCGAVFQYRYGPPSLPSSIDHTIPITKKLYFEKVIVSQNIFKTYLWQL